MDLKCGIHVAFTLKKSNRVEIEDKWQSWIQIPRKDTDTKEYKILKIGSWTLIYEDRSINNSIWRQMALLREVDCINNLVWRQMALV